MRVLVTAVTHEAIDNVLNKVAKLQAAFLQRVDEVADGVRRHMRAIGETEAEVAEAMEKLHRCAQPNP